MTTYVIEESRDGIVWQPAGGNITTQSAEDAATLVEYASELAPEMQWRYRLTDAVETLVGAV